MKREDFTVGQKVWFVPRERYLGKPRWETVAKIGRQWITLEGYNPYRFDPRTMRVDGGSYSSPAMVYLSQEDHERDKALSVAWGALADLLRRTYSCPSHLTLEQIQSITKTLRGEP